MRRARDGCSFGNAGMIVPSHFVPLAAPGMVALALKWMWNPESPFYMKPRLSPDSSPGARVLARGHAGARAPRGAAAARPELASHRCFEELAALPGSDFGLVRKGLLMLCRTRHALDEESETAEMGRALGIAAEVLDANAVAALDPGIRMDVAGAVYFPQDCHLTPDRFVDRAAGPPRRRRASNSSGTPRSRAGASSADRHVRAVTTRDGREIEGDEFVLCGGSWTPRHRARARPRAADPGRQRLQPHAADAAPASGDLRHPDRGARRRHADGRRAALRRHDGNRRPQRGHQSGARARHHRGRDEVLSRDHGRGFRRHRAVARAAAVLAGRDALPRPHRALRESLASPPAMR